MVVGFPRRDTGLLPLCEAMSAASLARLASTSSGLHFGVLALWPFLRPLRAPSLRQDPRSGLLRMHRVERSLFYEEFGDTDWETRWAPDLQVLPDPSAEWLVTAAGLELRGLGGRTLDLGGQFCPPVAAFSIAAQALPAEAAVGYVVLADAARRACAWLYVEWHQDLVGAPGLSLWINDHKVVLPEWPWRTSLKISFELDWAAKELTEIRLDGRCVLRGEGLDFHHADCAGVRHVSLSSRRGTAARARWEAVQLWQERQTRLNLRRRVRPPFLEMVL